MGVKAPGRIGGFLLGFLRVRLQTIYGRVLGLGVSAAGNVAILGLFAAAGMPVSASPAPRCNGPFGLAAHGMRRALTGIRILACAWCSMCMKDRSSLSSAPGAGC